MNEAVNRINRGDEPSEVLAWLMSETGISAHGIGQRMRFAVKTRLNWKEACLRLLAKKKPERAPKAVKLPKPPKPPKPQKPPRPVRVPLPRGRPITDTPYKVQRRSAIVDALSSHASGLTTTALLKVAGCTERILRNDLTAMAEKGILVHSDFCKGRPTIWRLAK